MQPSLLPSTKAASSIFDAIKDGDWEGLLALYATTAYDAVRSADFARGGADLHHHREHSSPHAFMAASPRRGVFRDGENETLRLCLAADFCIFNCSPLTYRVTRSSFFTSEKKIEGFHLNALQQSSKSTPDTLSSPIHDLDLIVREIIGAGVFDDHQGRNSETCYVAQETQNTKPSPQVIQPNKRKSPPGLSLDGILLQNHSHNPSVRRDKEMKWEKIMWDSASIISNSRPSPSFVVYRQDRDHRQDFDGGVGSLSMEEVGNKARQDEDQQNPTPIFEGNVANATPGDLMEGGTGAGTAQHLACLLDSPFALALLIVLGVNIESRHTAFRRLAIHEAACADSPICLGLLMEVGSRFSLELFRDTVVSPVSPSAASPAREDSVKSSATHFPVSSPSFAAASTTGFCSFDSINESFSGETAEDRTSQRKQGKKKLNFFPGWHNGKTSGSGSPFLKKSPLDECEKTSESTSFPVALKVMWDAVQFLRSGDMNELDAAHHILDRVKISKKAMVILALQCPHLPPTMKQNEEKSHSSPFTSIPALSAVNQLFQSNHRDMQSLFIKRNVDGHGNTPLHWAAFKDSVRAMDVLISYNVDVNSRAQPSGWTPLHDAAYSDASNAVARLIEAGASVDARSHSGATPLCFAAQEDAPNATRMLLKAGADPSMRCLGNSPGIFIRANNADNNQFHSRFSGYSPLHYCAHYNAAQAARVLLYETRPQRNLPAVNLLEIPDLNEKLPIHVAVARGSSLVLRELLHGGARVETPSHQPPASPIARAVGAHLSTFTAQSAPLAIPRHNAANDEAATFVLSTSPIVVTPVSSPILRAMIPSQPISSTKPWNCLSQTSIDACKHLITEVEMNWTPERHSLFAPADRIAILEVLRVGKRLEQAGRGIFLDLWPHVLSFCGRGWFEPAEEGLENKVPAKQREYDDEEEISMQCSTSSMDSSGEDMEDFTQFQLDGTSSTASIL